LTVNASNQVQLIGTSADGKVSSGLYAQAEPGASGKAGDLTINTNTLLVRDGARVSVRSFQGQAGNMTIRANSLLLDQGRLFAETAKSDAQGGANITLIGLDLLRMDNESFISANALDLAKGGNITIDSTFIVATPPTGSKGSDITANAVRGNGGRVNITTQGLFGIEFRPQLTPKNDITVSSNFGLTGEFQLNSPDVDPSRGLTNLPTDVADVSNQIAQACPSDGGKVAQNQFIVTGRGGLPDNPSDALSSDVVWTDLRNPSVVSRHPSEEPVTPKAVTPQAPIMEANGWVINDKGEVVLTAAAPTVILYSRGWTQSQCHVSQTSRE
jgi:large exoprotein involved in heme utilization and adhesion